MCVVRNLDEFTGSNLLVSAWAEGIGAGRRGALLYAQSTREADDQLSLARGKPALFAGRSADLHGKTRTLQDTLLFAGSAESFSQQVDGSDAPLLITHRVAQFVPRFGAAVGPWVIRTLPPRSTHRLRCSRNPWLLFRSVSLA